MSELLIKGGRVIDPASGYDKSADVLIQEDHISEIRPHIRRRSGMEVIAAEGQWVLPGFIDMHAHFREPGEEFKETVRTGSEAAAAGGFTSVACMANTQPPHDNALVTQFLKEKAREESLVNLYFVGALTRGLAGKELAEIGEMAGYGIVALSDDGHCIVNAHVMRKGLEYAKTFSLPVIVHAEDPHLTLQAGIHEGLVATELGLQGTPAAAEATMVARDCSLAALTRAHVHIAHVSSEESLKLIRSAKSQQISVSCEVTPHHLVLNHEALLGFRTEAKVNPPLRTEQDRRALWQALKDGTIDVIATDHAPHSILDKEVSFEEAASGISGLETAVALVWTEAQKWKFEPLALFAKLTCGPARLLGLSRKGRLEPSLDADVTLFAPEERWKVAPEKFRSKGRNTPFAGLELTGRVTKTIVAGEIVYEA